MVLVFAWVLCLMKSTPYGDVRWPWCLLAGVFAGLGWCVRNDGLALLAASLAYAALALRWTRPADVLRGGIAGAVGCVGASGWLLWHNLAVFGTAIPYRMPLSDTSLWQNVRQATYVIAKDMSGGSSKIRMLLSHPVVMMALVAGALGLAVVADARWSVRNAGCSRSPYRPLLLLGLFALAHVGMIVAARTVYRFDALGSRFFVCTYWPALLVVYALAFHILQRGLRSKRAAIVALCVVCSFVAARQLRQAMLDITRGSADPLRSAVGAAAKLGRLIASDQIVLSDQAPVLRVFGDMNARLPGRPARGEAQVTLPELISAARQGILWGVIAADRSRFAEGFYGEALGRLVREPQEFAGLVEVTAADPLVLKFRHAEGEGP